MFVFSEFLPWWFKWQREYPRIFITENCMCVSHQQYVLHHYYSWLNILSCSSVCLCVYPCPFPFTAVISAHPIHSLDNHHHHYHMGSLASPTRSYLYHQGSGHPRPHACATPISHLERVDSTGETLPPAGQQEKYRGGPGGLIWSFIHWFVICSFIHMLLPSCCVHILVFQSVTNDSSLTSLPSQLFFDALFYSPQFFTKIN